jgi:hypothetical protein
VNILDQLPDTLEALDPDELRKKLFDLDREASAIKLLLKAVLARQRKTAAMVRLESDSCDTAKRRKT